MSYNKLTCSYCNNKGHTPNACYIRNIGIPNGKFICIEKEVNPQGPKPHQVPNKS